MAVQLFEGIFQSSHLKQIHILDDKNAVEYLSNRADLHMKSFEKKVHRLHVDIDEDAVLVKQWTETDFRTNENPWWA